MAPEDKNEFLLNRFSSESDIAFRTMLHVGANNLCDEQLWKDLCAESEIRLWRSQATIAKLREALEYIEMLTRDDGEQIAAHIAASEALAQFKIGGGDE